MATTERTRQIEEQEYIEALDFDDLRDGDWDDDSMYLDWGFFSIEGDDNDAHDD